MYNLAFIFICRRPTSLKDQTKGTADDYRDRDYDVAALAVNLSTASRFETYDVNDEVPLGFLFSKFSTWINASEL